MLILNAVVLVCCERRVSSVRICFDYMPVCKSICSRKFILFYCVLTRTLCASLKESTNCVMRC
jgi:hypothetical protein